LRNHELGGHYKGIDSGLVGDLMMKAVEKRFGSNGKLTKTIEWLTDHGSCHTAEETRSLLMTWA
jgi:putative transposase